MAEGNTKLDFADLKFKIECGKMLLTKNDGTLSDIHAPGEIWQDAEGILWYKMFVGERDFLELQKHLMRPLAPGKIIKEDAFFTLQAQDYSLPVWSSFQIIPGTRGGLVEGFACGSLSELVHHEEFPKEIQTDHVTLRLRGKLNFPCNRSTETIVRVGGKERRKSASLNVAFVDFHNFKFEIYHEGNHTVVALSLPDGQMNETTPSRIEEALQFVFGQQLAVMVVETMAGGEHITRLTSPRKGHGKIMPPIQFNTLDRDGAFWKLFTDYFQHIHANGEAGWHPISCHVGSVIEASEASLGTQILALSVAVEGTAGLCFPDLAPVSPDFLKELDDVQAALNDVTLTDQSRRRIVGSLNAMRRQRNSDVLKTFIGEFNLPAHFYDSWSRLRNTSAHGGAKKGLDVEKLLQRKYEALTLLYSLVFVAIGYSGPRTDYSLAGWPKTHWPPSGGKAALAPPPSDAIG